jgi:hypothetical protein
LSTSNTEPVQADLLEQEILSQLFFNEKYRRKVLPHLKEKYFHNRAAQISFSLIAVYSERYKSSPSEKQLLLDLNERSGLFEQDIPAVTAIIESLYNEDRDLDWLVDHTEKFCQRQAFYNTTSAAVAAIHGVDKRHQIPVKFQEALAVSFKSKGFLMSLDDIVSNYTPSEYLIERLFKDGDVYIESPSGVEFFTLQSDGSYTSFVSLFTHGFNWLRKNVSRIVSRTMRCHEHRSWR